MELFSSQFFVGLGLGSLGVQQNAINANVGQIRAANTEWFNTTGTGKIEIIE